MEILAIILVIILGPYVITTIGGIIWGIIESIFKNNK